MIGKTISHYKIIEKLGGGGMGVVYKAQDTKLDRTVALKFLPSHLHLDEEAEQRFISEAKAASSFDHPNICTIYEIDKTDDDPATAGGQLFIAMACYEGETLKKKLENGPLKINEVVDYCINIAQGLQRAHEAGITHRDIKPANIMITNRGEVKILDFGLAKTLNDPGITIIGSTIGTAAYMSPEQAKGEEVNHRTDIWSFGVVFYEMLTGQLPFKGDYEQAVIYSILNEDPYQISNYVHDIPNTLVNIVNKCLMKNSGERYQYVMELLYDLRAVMKSPASVNEISTDKRTIKEKESYKSIEELESLGRHRKLSAIMFTDMVGYSAMVQKNESLALALLQEHRNILRPIFPKHRGNEVETAGDAFFVEFKSALEATNCAIEMQKVLHERNLKVEPEKKILIRIGLHVGDVVHMGKHVHGDGVNIAARIEPLSVPGGICLSEDVYRQIHNKIDLPLIKLGTKNLKNIKSPIDIYSIDLPWIKNLKQPKKQITFKPTTKRNFISIVLIVLVVLSVLIIWNSTKDSGISERNIRIAVLPLLNISNDSQDDYFADGMTEELISQLAKISGLNVIARTSVMKYKNSQLDIEEIGKELDVGTILAGSVRKASDLARITVQLIDVKTQEHLWTEEYDRELKDIFAIQSDIALRIANELKIQLVASEKQQIEKKGTENAEAYRLYLLGKYQLNIKTAESIFKGIEYFNSAIELDPNYALPYVGLADCYTLIGGAGYGSFSRDEAIKLAKDAVNNALQIDNSLADAYNSLAYLQFRLEWDWEAAESNFKKAIELKPGFAAAYERYALFLALLGRNDEALPLMLRASELDPLSPSVSTGVGRIFHFSRQYDKAIEQFNSTLELDPDYVEAVFARGLTYSQMGRYDDAISELQNAIELSNDRLIIISALGSVYAMAGLNEEALKIYEQLINLSNDKYVSPFYFGIIDAALGNYDNAFDSLYKAYDEHFGILVYIKASPIYNNLKSDQRFVELTRMIGLEK